MGYRPICDTWILARPKLKDGHTWFGSYSAGYLERARFLLGIHINDPLLHICGGMVRHYPYKRAFGPNDKTLDLDPETEPDFLQDARKPYPLNDGKFWPATLADPPFDEHYATYYKPGPDLLPSPKTILKNSLEVVRPGGRVGILHWFAPTATKDCKFIAAIGVFTGFNNRIRLFSVYEKLIDEEDK